MIDIDKFIKDHIGLINGTEATSMSSEFPQDWVGVGENYIRTTLQNQEDERGIKEAIWEIKAQERLAHIKEFPYCHNRHESKRSDVCTECGAVPEHCEIGKIIVGNTDIFYDDDCGNGDMDDDLYWVSEQLPHKLHFMLEIIGETLYHNEPQKTFIVGMDYYKPVVKILSIEVVEDV
jgi:hypothetical protein